MTISSPNKTITLTAEQRRIVLSDAAYIEVVACPGSGKTFTLAQRVKHLIASGTAPERILVVSFGNQTVAWAKAALLATANTAVVGTKARAGASSGSSTSAVSGVIGKTALDKVVVTTFHALGLKIVQSELGAGLKAKERGGKHDGEEASTGTAIRLISPGTSRLLLDSAISSLRATVLKDKHSGAAQKSKNAQNAQDAQDLKSARDVKKYRPTIRTDLKNLMESKAGRRALLKMFERRRTGEATVSELLAFPEAASVAALIDITTVRLLRRAYERQKRKAGLLDFSDMLGKGAKILRDGKTSLDFEHVLVDEFQDMNPLQCRFLAAIVLTVPNVIVFSDPLQAVYGFAGARFTPLADVLSERLDELNQEVVQLTLSRSRRLSQANADFATGIIAANGGQAPLIEARPGGARPIIISLSNWDDLRDELVARVSKLIAAGVVPSEIVVLGRVKALLTSVQSGLHSAGINVQHLGRAPNHKHVLRVLRLVEWCEMEAAAAMGAMEPNAVRRPSEIHRHFRDSTIGFCARYKLVPKDNALQAAVRDLKKLVAVVGTMEGRYIACSRVYMRLAGIRMRGGLMEQRSSESKKVHRQLTDVEIRNCLACWSAKCRDANWATASLMRSQIRAIKSAQAVETRTIHSAKGREWEHVFVVGATDGLLPHYRAQSELARNEELNLMYVAATRPRTRLTLMHAPYTYAIRRPASNAKNGKRVRTGSPHFTKLSSLLKHPLVNAAAVSKVR